MGDETLLHLDVKRPRAGTVVVAVHGEVDMLTAPELAAGLEQQLDRASALVVDLSEVEFFGAAGLEVLVQVQSETRQRGLSLRLVVGPHLRRLLALVDLEGELCVHDARG